MSILDEIIGRSNHSEKDLILLLSPVDDGEERLLFQRACEIKKRHVGDCVYLRGLVEISNICEKDCYYCGIRKGNALVNRYRMKHDEIIHAAGLAWRWGYGSLTLQAGEITGEWYVKFIEETVRMIKKISGSCLGITLSLGEQDEGVYRRWFEAGAHRYLLRIETSDRSLYESLHPQNHSFDRRLECLGMLKEIGYQVGTGVMIGLPGQTIEHLARDIIFFRDIDADMIGMGPYIPNRDTPLAGKKTGGGFDPFNMSLRMIAAARIALKDINIASTTALQALDESGREKGIMAGANVIMPNMTDVRYRRDYQLYDNKPCIDENSELCRGCLESRISSIGEHIGYNQWGDSPHFKRKSKDVSIS